MNADQITPPLRGFVLCADDYAMSPGVSAGILALLDARRISATGAMTNRPTWRAAAHDLAPFAGKADLGLHFTLTCGAPLRPSSELAPDGQFMGLGALMRRVLRGQIPANAIRAELTAQLDAFEAELGRAPDFVDGHQHVHAMPGLAAPVIATLDARYPARTPYLRDPSEQPSTIMMRKSSVIRALGVSFLGQGFGARARAARFATNRGFSGFSDFDPRRDFSRDFLPALQRLGPKPLVMCHPGFADAALAGLDRAVASRPLELAFFRSARFLELLAASGLRPCRFSEL